MVPEIQSVTNRIFSHFGSFFSLLPPNNLKNQNFEELKKTSADIILHKCTICYTVSKIWGVTDLIFIFHFELFFYPFTSLTAQKIKI